MKGLWNEERRAMLVMWLVAVSAVAMFIGVLTWTGRAANSVPPVQGFAVQQVALMSSATDA